jgi:hypothetical protein
MSFEFLVLSYVPSMFRPMYLEPVFGKFEIRNSKFEIESGGQEPEWNV